MSERDFTAFKERAAAISEDRSLEADWASRALADLLYEVLEALEDEPAAPVSDDTGGTK